MSRSAIPAAESRPGSEQSVRTRRLVLPTGDDRVTTSLTAEVEAERLAVAAGAAWREMSRKNPSAGVGDLFEKGAARLPGLCRIFAMPAVPIWMQRLNRVMHHVSDGDGAFTSGTDAHRDMSRGMPGRGLERHAA